MMKKSIPILAISFLTVFLGMLSFFISFTGAGLRGGYVLRIFSSIISPMNLEFFNLIRPRHGYLINLLFTLILLLGGILYAINNKEIRIIRFIFAMIFLDNLVSILMILVALSGILSAGYFRSLNWMEIILLIFSSLFYAGISFWLLRQLKDTTKISTTTIGTDASAIVTPVEATLGQRLIHIIVDLLVCLLILSKISLLISHRVEPIAHLIGLRTVFILLILFFRITYYLFFETIFNATPAKFLTQTKVATEKGGKPELNSILTRTFCRFVPFEPWSFVFHQNWHDSWSKTAVYKEEMK